MVFDTALYSKRKITRDCLVSYQGCRYSVPHPFAGREATIRDHEDGRFDVLVDGEVEAVHKLSAVKGKTILVSSHYEGIKTGERSARKSLPLLSSIPPVLVEQRPLSVYEAYGG